MPDFNVNFVVTRAEAKAAHEAEDAAYKKHVANADTAAKEVEDASNREAAARKRAVSEVLTAEQAMARAQEELIRRTNAALVKAAADRIDLAKKEARAQEELIRQTKAANAKAAADRIDLAKKEAKAIAKAAADRIDLAKKEAKAIEDSHERVASVGGKLASVFSSIGSAAFGLNGISSVITMIADSFERAKNQAQDAGKFVEDYRKVLKEIAFLKGEPGATAQVVKEDLAFRAQTLQSAEGARQTQEEFRNIAGISIDTKDTRRRMSQEEAEKAMIYAGQLGSRVGGDASFGKLAGIIPSTEGKDRVTGEDVKRRLYQMTLLGQASATTPDQFATQMAGTAYLSQKDVGGYRSLSRQGAVGAAIGLFTPTEVGTGLEQIHRATKGSISDVSKPAGASTSPAEYLQSIKATDQMDDLDILQLMFADIEKAEEEQRKKGLKLDLTSYLKDKGYANIHDLGRISQLYGARKDLSGTLIPMSEKLPTAQEADEQFAKFKGTPTGMSQQASFDTDLGKTSFGGGALEFYKNLESRAIDIQLAYGQISGKHEDWEGSRNASSAMLELLRQEGIAKGQDWAVQYDTEGGQHDPLAEYFRGWAGTKERAEGYYELAQKVKSSGGDPMASNSEAYKEFMAMQQRQMSLFVSAELSLRGINEKLNPAPVAVVAPGGANNGPAR